MSDLLSLLAAELERLIAPLELASHNDDARAGLFAALGWQLDSLTGFPTDALVTTLGTIASDIEALASTAATPPQGPADISALANRIGQNIAAIRALSELAADPNLVAPPAVIAALASLGEDLLDFLVDEYLVRYHPVALHVLTLLTLADPPDFATLMPAIDGSGTQPLRYPVTLAKLRLDRLSALLTDPVGTLRGAYLGGGLSTPEDAQAAAGSIFGRLAPMLAATGATVTVGIPPPDGPAGLDPQRALSLQYDSPDSSATTGISALLQLIAQSEGGPGLSVTPAGVASATWELPTWTVDLEVSAVAGQILLVPTGVSAQQGSAATSASLSVESVAADGVPAAIIGVPLGTSLRIGSAKLTGQVDVSAAGQELGIELRLSDCVAAIASADGDGFLAATLPSDGLSATFDVDLGWSSSRGLYLGSGTGLSCVIGVNATLAGIARLDSVNLAVTPGPDGSVGLIAAITGELSIGPIVATVSQAGVEVQLSFPPGSGNLGVANLDKLGFKPPDGIGLAIDAGPVTGGGFVLCDPAKQQYTGLLQLSLLDQLSATVIAALDATGPGWSLLGLVFVDGFEPIQLGFGFTLDAVGGMVGLNRSAAVDALRASLRSGGLDAVMFPANPVAQAAKLIGQLEQDFPVTPGRYLLGPMAEIGWGDPTILRIKLGLLIELPAPIRLVLLAQMSALLPDEQTKLIELHVDAVGDIDFGGGTAALDAVLHDSRIAAFALSGQLALRAAWGAQRELVLAIGGLHPRFQPPPGFPVLPRVIIAMASGDNPRLRLEAYLAVTSNTIQVGAKLELHAAAGDFTLDGSLGFDALFHLNPFSFEAELAGGMALTYKGSNVMTVALDLLLSGPAPWHAKGTASFSVLMVNVTISFDVSWGQPADLTAPVTAPDPAARLLAALGAASSWGGQAPSGLNSLVGLRPVASDGPVAHPLGTLVVHQREVPLGLELQRFGGTELSQPVTLGIDTSSVTVGGLPAVGLSPVQDYFAPAQYRDLTDDQKLSSPSYESYQSGLSFGLAGFAMASWQNAPIGYVTLVADPDAPPPALAATPALSAVAPTPATLSAATPAPATTASASASPASYQPPGASLAIQVATGSAAQAPAPGQNRYQGEARPYGTAPATYLVLGTADLAQHADGGLPQQPVSFTQARDALAAYLAAHPGAQGQLQVASAHLAAAGAAPPRSQLVIGTPQYQAQTSQPWISPATTLDIDALAGTAVASVSYRWYQQGMTPPAWTVVTGRQASFSLIGPDGFYQLDWHAADAAGNTEAMQSQILRLDGTAPVSALTGSPLQEIAGAWLATSATQFTLTATDAGSGVASLSYRCYQQGTTPPAFTQVTGSQVSFAPHGPDGAYQVDWYATDEVGNAQAQQGQQVTLDTQAPVSTLAVGSPQFPPGAPQFVSSQTQLAITASDPGSGVASLSYRWYAQGTTAPAFTTISADSARFALSGIDGSYQLDWYSADNLGNTEDTHHQVLELDNTAPASALVIGSPDYVPGGSAQYVTSATPFTLTATDAGSGVRSINYRYYQAGQPATPWTVVSGAQAPFTLQGTDGPYQLDWYATDQLGNTGVQQGRQVTLDNTAPAPILSVTGPQYPASSPQFVTAQSQIGITASDAGAGVATLSYRWYAHGGPAPAYSVVAASSARLTLSGPDGGYQVDWYATDKLGNTSVTSSQVLQLDSTAPASELSVGSPDYVPSATAQYVTSGTPFTLTATDAESGVRSISYRYYPVGQPAAPWTIVTGAQASFTIQGADGPYQLDWYATDQLGNTQAQLGHQLTLDNAPPATTLAITGPLYPASAPQFVTNASVLKLSATDAVSGVAALFYRSYVHGTQPPPLTQVATAQASFSLHGPDGQYQVDWQAMNHLGTLETLHSQLIYLDNSAPAITITQPATGGYVHSATLVLGYSVSDGTGCGVSAVTPTLDGQVKLSGHGLANGQQIVLLTELALGNHVFAVTASDNLGNSRTTSVTFSVIVTAASIKQDVTYFQGTGDITSASVATALLNYLNAAATSESSGLYSAAASNYRGFINLIAAQNGKTISAASAAIMTADAQYLINNPPTSGGIGSPQG